MRSTYVTNKSNKIVNHQQQHFLSSRAFSFDSLFLRNPASSYSLKIYRYFLNLYLSLSFLDSMYKSILPSLICLRVYLARKLRASFMVF